MFNKILRVVFTIIGLVLGYIFGDALLQIPVISEISFLQGTGSLLFLILCILLFGFIFMIAAPIIQKKITNLIDYTEKGMQSMSATEIIYGFVGAVIPVLIMSLIGLPIMSLPGFAGPLLYVLFDIIVAIIGADFAIKRREEIANMIAGLKKGTTREKKTKKENKKIAKVLDTSVIIDGRIFDICQTGFVEGPLVIPNFVLDELRHISDSADSLKRNRGRRGLDILNKIQKELDIETEIWEGDSKEIKEIKEVDAKLLKLAQNLGGKVVTNDYNLNKVAEVQGVPVLNINELANAIKPIVLPGEVMRVIVVKDGKEHSQGIGYLDDGTMIVVEGGKKFIGESIQVLVTSVLQTAAGRMIFAKPKE